MKNTISERKVYALMVLAALSWAGAFIAGKISVQEFPPFSLTFFRFLFAAAIIFPIMARPGEKNWKLKRKDLPVMLVLGIGGMLGYHVLFFTSLKYTTAINDSMIGASNPVISSILAAIFLGERLGVKRLGAVLLAFFGILLTISGGDIQVFRSLSFNKGDLIMLSAVLCWAAYGIISRRASVERSPLFIIAYSFLICTIVSIPFVIMENPLSYLPKVTWKGWVSVLYMAVFASCVGYLLQQVSIKAIGVSKTMAFVNLVPVFSIILSVIILKENVNAIKLLSTVIIIAGVYFNSRIKDEPEKSEAQSGTQRGQVEGAVADDQKAL